MCSNVTDIWLTKNGNMHIVVYNQDLQSPTIVLGWIALRDFYQLTKDHQVTLIHYGQSVYLLTIFKTNNHPKSFPKWHSLYHQVLNLVTFTVLLNQYKITCSSLVSYLTRNLIIQLIFICHIFNFFHFSHKVVVNIRMYRVILLFHERQRIQWFEFGRHCGMSHCLQSLKEDN